MEDLSQASPATVSRAGMIYLNVEDLGWRPFITSWLAAKTPGPLVDHLAKMVDKWMDATLEHKRLHCRWETQGDTPQLACTAFALLCSWFCDRHQLTTPQLY